MGRGLLKQRADFVAILEALYAPSEREEQWAARVIDAASATLESPMGTGISVVGHRDDYSQPTGILTVNSSADVARALGPVNDSLPFLCPELFRAFYYPGRPFTSHGELERGLPVSTHEQLRGIRAGLGVRDVFGVFGYPEPGVAAVLYWGVDSPEVEPAPNERRQFHLLASHVDTAFRLRTRPEQVVAAVLAPDGRLLDLERDEPAERREKLSARVVSIERARLRARRREREAIDGWNALIDGRYTLAPREDRDSQRFYLLVENPPALRVSTAFSAREADILRLAARGFSGKESAYALGISQATVSDALARAAAKLGLRSRVELVRVASAMFGPRAQASDKRALTAAERDVLNLLRRGLSNAEIARLRERSPRTVANQVASLLAKTGSPTRRALAARVPGGA